MKNRALKAVYGVILSTMLVITVAIPALAACGDSHNPINAIIQKTYPYASENKHQVRLVAKGTCVDCGEFVTIENTYTEPHSVNINGKCTACGYQVWH